MEYTERIKNVTITPYTRGTVKTLKLVTANHIEYAHKFVDRSEIHHLLAGIRADDILMLKNGQITDTSIANIAFFDGKQWITPSSPLLPGTTRARLLDEGRLTAEEISQENLHRFSKAVLVNAMLGFDPDSYIEMKNIAP